MGGYCTIHFEKNGQLDMAVLSGRCSEQTKIESLNALSTLFRQALEGQGVETETVTVMKRNGAIGHYSIPITEPATTTLVFGGRVYENKNWVRDHAGHRFFTEA